MKVKKELAKDYIGNQPFNKAYAPSYIADGNYAQVMFLPCITFLPLPQYPFALIFNNTVCIYVWL